MFDSANLNFTCECGQECQIVLSRGGTIYCSNCLTQYELRCMTTSSNDAIAFDGQLSIHLKDNSLAGYGDKLKPWAWWSYREWSDIYHVIYEVDNYRRDARIFSVTVDGKVLPFGVPGENGSTSWLSMDYIVKHWSWRGYSDPGKCLDNQYLGINNRLPESIWIYTNAGLTFVRMSEEVFVDEPF